MEFNNHWQLEGKHAFLGASKYHWLGYDDEKLESTYRKRQNTMIGDRKHALAAEHIRLKIKMPRNNQTLNAYINDAIGFNLRPEVTLRYSDRCFGTADAIGFEKRVLRIFDLKTGESPSNMKQCLIYAGLFCLEYRVDPFTIDTILRIYQNNANVEYQPSASEVKEVMARIKHADSRIQKLEEAGV